MFFHSRALKHKPSTLFVAGNGQICPHSNATTRLQKSVAKSSQNFRAGKNYLAGIIVRNEKKARLVNRAFILEQAKGWDQNLTFTPVEIAATRSLPKS
jgi:hypothetical protein